MVVRKYEEELKFIERISDHSWRIKKGFQVSWIELKINFAGTERKISIPAEHEGGRNLLREQEPRAIDV